VIDWTEVDEALERGALDDGILDPAVADAVLLKDLYDTVVEQGGPLRPDEIGQSVLYPLGGPRWPWQNPEALAILADEPGFDLQVVLANLPA
jgi:hypothetical protein